MYDDYLFVHHFTKDSIGLDETLNYLQKILIYETCEVVKDFVLGIV